MSAVALDDTYALLTSAGPAGIAVIAVQGEQVGRFLARHVRGRTPTDGWRAGDLRRAALVDATGEVLDDILVNVRAAGPAWDIQLHMHGSPIIVARCTELLDACGLRRADVSPVALWKPADGVEAEACALLPRVLTERGVQWVFDQVQGLRALLTAALDQDTQLARSACLAAAERWRRAAWFTRPLRVVLAGPVNAGKSTLANALADRPISIISATPGTTRDWVDYPSEAGGFPVIWVDTAGWREAADPLEAAAIGRTEHLIAQAEAVVVVLDATPAALAERAAFVRRFQDVCPAAVALTKADLNPAAGEVSAELPASWRVRAVSLSALRGEGLDSLRASLLAATGRTAGALEAPGALTESLAFMLKAVAQQDDHNMIRTRILQLVSGTTAQPPTT